MKKSFLIGLMFIGFLYSGCDTKSTIDDSVIAKKSLQESKFVSQTFNLTTIDGKVINFKSTEEGIDFADFNSVICSLHT